MTKYAKILAIFVMFACLAFMGFAAAVTIAGRPNWDGEREKLSGDFKFESPTETNPSWKVTSRRDSSFSKTSEVLADVVLAARAHVLAEKQKEITGIEEEIPRLEARIQESKQLIEIDLTAMKKREDELEVQIGELSEEIETIGKQGISVAQQAQTVRAEAELRREDVFRLRDQLEELHTDVYQIREQKRQLRDQLVRMTGVLARLQRRSVQLQKSASKSEPYEPDSGSVQ